MVGALFAELLKILEKAGRAELMVYEFHAVNWRLPNCWEFWRAARLSIDESFAGRVGLHTLPQSAGFYANACEMTSCGMDSNNLEYLELTAAKAAVLINK